MKLWITDRIGQTTCVSVQLTDQIMFGIHYFGPEENNEFNHPVVLLYYSLID